MPTTNTTNLLVGDDGLPEAAGPRHIDAWGAEIRDSNIIAVVTVVDGVAVLVSLGADTTSAPLSRRHCAAGSIARMIRTRETAGWALV